MSTSRLRPPSLAPLTEPPPGYNPRSLWLLTQPGQSEPPAEPMLLKTRLQLANQERLVRAQQDAKQRRAQIAAACKALLIGLQLAAHERRERARRSQQERHAALAALGISLVGVDRSAGNSPSRGSEQPARTRQSAGFADAPPRPSWFRSTDRDLPAAEPIHRAELNRSSEPPRAPESSQDAQPARLAELSRIAEPPRSAGHPGTVSEASRAALALAIPTRAVRVDEPSAESDAPEIASAFRLPAIGAANDESHQRNRIPAWPPPVAESPMAETRTLFPTAVLPVQNLVVTSAPSVSEDPALDNEPREILFAARYPRVGPAGERLPPPTTAVPPMAPAMSLPLPATVAASAELDDDLELRFPFR